MDGAEKRQKNEQNKDKLAVLIQDNIKAQMCVVEKMETGKLTDCERD